LWDFGLGMRMGTTIDEKSGFWVDVTQCNSVHNFIDLILNPVFGWDQESRSRADRWVARRSQSDKINIGNSRFIV
jgi:hypothetical protein